MSYGSDAVAESDSLEHNPLRRAITVLERQYLDTVELQAHVDDARKSIYVHNPPNIGLLLEGMSGELTAWRASLEERITSLLPRSVRPRASEIDAQPFWRLFQTDGSDCGAHLEALLSGYAHYSRATCDSIAFLELLGDADSVRLLQKISTAADKAIWFVEIYMEGLALRMDLARLPAFV